MNTLTTYIGMLLCLLLVGLLPSMLLAGQGSYRDHVGQYHNMVETSYNRGSFIDSANRKYAYLEAPYCACCVSFILDRCLPNSLKIRSASSRKFLVGTEKINAIDVFKGKAEVPKNGVAVWIRLGGGHIEFIIKQVNKWVVRFFGFNTSPGNAGSQHDGKWSGYRDRDIRKCCSPLSATRITHFVVIRELSND